MREIINNEHAVAIVELAIVITLLFGFIGGIISLGIPIHDSLAAEKATRHAARAGAAQWIAYPSLCEEQAYEANCAQLPSDPEATSSPVLSKSVVLACIHLIESGVAAEKWKLTARLDQAQCEGGFCTRVLKVDAQIDPYNSLLGKFDYFSNKAFSVESAFAVEGNCPSA